MIPAIRRRSVDLPEPLRPTSPTASPGSTATETSVSACTSCASVRPRRTNSSFRLRASFARTRKRRETPSTRIWPVFTVLTSPCRRYRAGDFSPDEPGEHADERRRGIRQLDPVELEAELRRALLGLDVDVPPDLEVVGDEADGCDEHLADTVRGERVEVLEDVRA